ncbi:MAG: TrkA C-terminal domain-containing protein, partial [Gracilimonas sp.]
WIARKLHVDSPIIPKTKFPVEFEPSVDTKSAMKELEIAEGDPIIGKQVIDLNFPDNSLIVIINREGKFLVPRGTTEIKIGDKLLILAQKEDMIVIRKIIKGNQFKTTVAT